MLSKILFVLISLPITLFPQNIIRVPNDYKTIQLAIDNAKGNDSIFISNGIYYEQIIITKPITILGSGIQETIIKPESTFGLPILINASNVSLSNLRVTASHNKYGLSIINSGYCFINNCQVDSTRPPLSMFSGEDGKGINIDSSNNISIINCIVSDNSGGGYLPDGANNGFGIYINNSNGIRITSTKVSNNKGGGPGIGVGYGISINNSTNVIIDSCTVNYHNEYDRGKGIDINNSSETYIRRNNINDNHTAIYISYNSSLLIGGSKKYSNNLQGNNLIIHLTTSGTFDATWNYWGFSNPDSISKYIFDCNDLPTLGCVDFGNYIISSISDKDNNMVTDFSLFQNYPNPFNPNTIISFSLLSSSFVELSVYNLLSEKVTSLISEFMLAGFYQINFLPRNISSGIYLYRLRAGNYSYSKKMMYMK